MRLTTSGATLLATSVLADSTLEHYRGSFHNPAMLAPIAASAVNIAIGAVQTCGTRCPSRLPRWSGLGAMAVGGVGLGFHAYNIFARPGRLTFNNLFYGAPVGAPGALVLSGLLTALANRTAHGYATTYRSGRLIGGVTVLGIGGSVAEAALLHFRGAYHNPAMWLPLLIPPCAAASLAVDLIRGGTSRRSTRLLAVTVLLGLAGAAFHAFGVSRNMGGWRNWQQNLLAGPPLPAPPAFTGLALAGLGSLRLEARQGHG